MFNNAIALEESYAEAHVSLSHMLMHLYWSHGRNREFLPGARKAAFRALEVAPDLPEAHVAVGRYYYQGCYDYEKALDEFAIARKSYPNHISAIRWTAYCQKRMGMFEDARFAAGTFAVAKAVAEATRSGATSIIGGGDSVKALNKSGLGEQVTFASTGGGASLEFLEGQELPGVAALTDKQA